MAWRSAEEWLPSGEGEACGAEHVWVLQLGAVEHEVHPEAGLSKLQGTDVVRHLIKPSPVQI